MHPLFLLLVFTLLVVIAFGIWNWMSVRRHQQTGGKISGIRGLADPMFGTTQQNIRGGADLRASLEEAATHRAQF